MRKQISKILALALVLGFGASFCLLNPTFAEDESKSLTPIDSSSTSISISPISKVLELSSESKYSDSFEIKNEGSDKIKVEVHAAPYSYVYSEEDQAYKLGFNTDNHYTQIARWVSFKAENGNWEKETTFHIDGDKSINVEYMISTPSGIPAGGQYAVIFAHALSSDTYNQSGIKTEASPGLILYGRSTEGEALQTAEISDLKIEQSVTKNGETRDNIFASAKIKNTGNVDFTATGILKVDAIIGSGSYETFKTQNENGETANGQSASTSGGSARVSIIPETELSVSDEWPDTPGFGIYRVTWTVMAGDKTETIEKIVFINPLPIIIAIIILLTIIIISVIIVIRKRKERRSRLAV